MSDVWIINRDKFGREGLALLVSTAGYNVGEFAHPDEAIEALEAGGRPDAVIFAGDQRFWEMTAHDFYKAAAPYLNGAVRYEAVPGSKGAHGSVQGGIKIMNYPLTRSEMHDTLAGDLAARDSQ